MYKDLLLEKKARSPLDDGRARRKLREISEVAQKNKTLGFTVKLGKLGDPEILLEEGDQVYRYFVRLRLIKKSVRDERVAENHFRVMAAILGRTASQDGWRVVEMGEETGVGRVPFCPPELTDEVLSTYFHGVYEREPHIRIIHDATVAYTDSLRLNEVDPSVPICRNHVLLYGRPAGCKTTLFERFKRWYEDGSEVERVMFLDAHTTSKAGLENYLLALGEEGNLPEFIVLEEIEKQTPDNLLALISVMGSGYVSKLTAPRGRMRSIANVVIWATANDETVIQNFRRGVLWSRFTDKLHCARPSPSLMLRILLERVEKLGGDPMWADKAFEFAYECWEKETGAPLDDPREILSLLKGRNRLLDGSYQKDRLSIWRSEKAEKGDELCA